MTKIESWLNNKLEKYLDESQDDSLNHWKDYDPETIIRNFVEFAFSDDICFLDEDEDEPTFEPEDCERCRRLSEESYIEYERNVTYKDGAWICDECGQPV